MDKISIDSFTGTWQARMAELTGVGNLTPTTLAKMASTVNITEKDGLCTVAWTDLDGKPCQIDPPLEFHDGRLEGGANIQVGEGKGAQEIKILSASVQLAVIVSFTKDVGSGNTGTFAAEAQPVGNEPPSPRKAGGGLLGFFRRWLG